MGKTNTSEPTKGSFTVMYKNFITEYKKIYWPKKQVVFQTTVIVLLVTLFIALFVSFFDGLFNFLMTQLSNII